LTLGILLALNDKEIFSQAFIFLLAGYETTSVLMSFFFYVMATEPSIQEKVYEEIREQIGDVCSQHGPPGTIDPV
jgi:cytochrome P450